MTGPQVKTAKVLAPACVRALALLLGVLTLAAACGAYSPPSSIAGSRHDLAHLTLSYHPWDDLNQICAYCHTPHNAQPGQASLWNRQAPTTSYVMYQSPSLDHAPGQPGRSSLACLSCHDGSMAVDAVSRRPLYGTVAQPANRHGAMTSSGTDSWVNCGVYCHGGGGGHGGWVDFSRTFFGSDISADHPIGIPYPDSPQFAPFPPGGKFPSGVRLVNGRVECVSCHDPHNPSIQPFLVTADSGSALCYTCHVK